MIPNLAVLPLAKSTARAQIEKVQSMLRDERRNEDTRHSGRAQGLELCAFGRWHGTWPDSWQLAFYSRASVIYGLLFAVGCKFHALSHFLNCDGLPQGLAFALHFHCREDAYDAGGTRERVQDRLNRPGNNSTQEVTQWKQLDC
jgi:hypothetical protein